MDKAKRERSANFTLHERDILISLVQKFKNILENKQSDASTWKKKEAAWETIEKEFNARSGGVLRTVRTLKVKYDGLKRTVRKKSAAIRSELYRTGGGKNTAPPLDNVEEQIKGMIALSADGLESIYDSDVLPQTQDYQDAISIPTTSGTINMEEFIIIETPSMDVESDVVIENKSTLREILPEENSAVKNQINNDIDEKVGDAMNLLLDNLDDKALDITPSTKYITETPSTSSHNKWDTTSRRNLKTRKHPALIANLQKNTNFDELTQRKLEVVQLQKNLLEAEIIEKNKEYKFKEKERKWREDENEFKEKERKWREEEYKLKLEKLRRELNE